MENRINIQAWKADGERLWGHVQEHGCVKFAWLNPWFRFIVLGLFLLALAAACQIFVGWWIASASVAFLSFLSLCVGIRFLVIDRRIGGLYFFYSTESFGIGGTFEWIEIPFAAVVAPQKISPSTVNSNYIVLPVPVENFSAISICRVDGAKHLWNLRPFKQAIAEVRVSDGNLIVKAFPNEFIVRFFSTLHPLVLHLNDKYPQALSAEKMKEST